MQEKCEDCIRIGGGVTNAAGSDLYILWSTVTADESSVFHAVPELNDGPVCGSLCHHWE
jgi:hypothetical protein